MLRSTIAKYWPGAFFYSVLVLTLLASHASGADAIKQIHNSPQAFDGLYLIKLLVSLLVVVALIVAAAWLMKRISGPRFGGRVGVLELVDHLSLGMKERVVLLRAGKRHILIGVCAEQIQTLHVFDEGEIPKLKGRDPNRFADLFKKNLVKE